MKKDFDNWNREKRKIQEEDFFNLFFHEREIMRIIDKKRLVKLLKKLAILTKKLLMQYEKLPKNYFDNFYCLPS